MRVPADRTPARDPFSPTAEGPAVRLDHLPHRDEPWFIKTAEHGQVSRDKDSVGHVEVFRLKGVGTPIVGRPRPPPQQRRATPSIAMSPKVAHPPIVDARVGAIHPQGAELQLTTK